MKKNLILSFLLLFTFIITGCIEKKNIIDYEINDNGELIAIYNDDTKRPLGNFEELVLNKEESFFPSTDGFYIINGIKTNIKLLDYIVKFESNNGTILPNKLIKWRSLIEEPNLTYPGYTLDGWYCNGEKWIFDSNIVENNIVLTANWIPNKYKIIIDLECPTDVLPTTIQSGEKYTLPNLNKEDYDFVGWELDGNIIPSEGIFNFARDIIVKPVWSKTHFLINFNTDGGNTINPLKVKKNSVVENLPTPVRDGYNFKGWFLNDLLIKVPFNFTEGNLNLTSKWEKIEDLKSYDPFYPEEIIDEHFEMIVPEIKDRIILNEDKTIATIFAPGVSKSFGYYDVNKNFQNDTSLCWAAATSNILAWYIDRLKETNIDLTNIDKDVESIFNNFKNNWDPQEGYDPLQGLAWYFTGNTTFNGVPENLLNPHSGGYLKYLPYVDEIWSLVDHLKYNNYFGSYSNHYPFVDEEINLNTSSEYFSKRIINQLHFGPTALTIVKENGSSASSHAITLWGCDYDTKTGMINKIYVTDSDDEAYQKGSWLKEVKIKPCSGDRVMKMENYYLPTGVQTPFLYIMSSTNLLAPNTIKLKK